MDSTPVVCNACRFILSISELKTNVELLAPAGGMPALKAALEAAHAGIQVLIQATRGLDSFYAERNGLIIGY